MARVSVSVAKVSFEDAGDTPRVYPSLEHLRVGNGSSRVDVGLCLQAVVWTIFFFIQSINTSNRYNLRYYSFWANTLFLPRRSHFRWWRQALRELRQIRIVSVVVVVVSLGMTIIVTSVNDDSVISKIVRSIRRDLLDRAVCLIDDDYVFLDWSLIVLVVSVLGTAVGEVDESGSGNFFGLRRGILFVVVLVTAWRREDEGRLDGLGVLGVAVGHWGRFYRALVRRGIVPVLSVVARGDGRLDYGD